MAHLNADIVIFGAGIAGLWTLNRLRHKGYDAVLLEANAIGGGQTVASQGILHSGMKYALGGKISGVAKTIRAMPERWRAALAGQGEIDLSALSPAATSQHLMIPPGLLSGPMKLFSTSVLGKSVHEVPQDNWPETLKLSGFKGKMVDMEELVLDIPALIRALSDPHRDVIRKIDWPGDVRFHMDGRDIDHIASGDHVIQAGQYIFTGAGSNASVAGLTGHEKGLKTQRRPLLMGLLKPAPFPLYAHLIGTSEKPVCSITTHKAKDGTLVWYLGGLVAERSKEADPQETIEASIKALHKFMPGLDLDDVEWATLPIDRVEASANQDGWLPELPSVHAAGNALYGWPTKLVFAPLLADQFEKHLDIEPSHSTSHASSDWSALPEAAYTETPWDTAQWTTLPDSRTARSDKRA